MVKESQVCRDRERRDNNDKRVRDRLSARWPGDVRHLPSYVFQIVDKGFHNIGLKKALSGGYVGSIAYCLVVSKREQRLAFTRKTLLFTSGAGSGGLLPGHGLRFDGAVLGHHPPIREPEDDLSAVVLDGLSSEPDKEVDAVGIEDESDTRFRHPSKVFWRKRPLLLREQKLDARAKRVVRLRALPVAGIKLHNFVECPRHAREIFPHGRFIDELLESVELALQGLERIEIETSHGLLPFQIQNC